MGRSFSKSTVATVAMGCPETAVPAGNRNGAAAADGLAVRIFEPCEFRTEFRNPQRRFLKTTLLLISIPTTPVDDPETEIAPVWHDDLNHQQLNELDVEKWKCCSSHCRRKDLIRHDASE
ncbi:MAG: hypothetical protein R3C49_14505 [Planctomycetaceae bacterium]